MSPKIRSGPARVAMFAAAFSSLAVITVLAGAARAQEPCAPFVRLVDGKFFEGNAPYAMEGPNFTMAVAATVDTQVDPPQWDYFLAPYDAYQPDGKAVCTGPSATPCCSTEAGCHADLQVDVDGLTSMGANSVRLIVPHMEWDQSTSTYTPYLPCTTVSTGSGAVPPCKLDLMDPDQRTRALELIEEQIDWLGDYGIRTVLLTGRTNAGDQHAVAEYDRWLDDLSARLVNNPYLIAYDPMNEPPYAYDVAAAGYSTCPGDPASDVHTCKNIASSVSRDWYTHLTTNDPNHLVSIGLGGSGSVLMWDPAVLWDHFTSYHIYSYPAGPWNDPGPGGPVAGPPFPAPAKPVSGGHAVEDDIYYGSLNGCGVPCPYVGDYDGANCYVTAGPNGTGGTVSNGSFQYPHLAGAIPCPVGTDIGPACEVGTYDPGRDVPFILGQPVYTVNAQNGSCPSGMTLQGSSCIASYGPPGASPFLWTGQGGSTGFYYNYLSPTEHCRAPATDDTVHCYVGAVPTGWTPVILSRPLYYVTAVACNGTRKPIHFGETGFSVYPYPTGSRDYWASNPPNVPKLTALRNQCNDVEAGPELDFLVIDGQFLEAESATVTNSPGFPASIQSCSGCSGGSKVLLYTGAQVDVDLPNGASPCASFSFGYRSIIERRLVLTTAGRAPRQLRVPSSGGSWNQISFPLDIPAGTTTFTITAPHDAANGNALEQAQFLTGNGGSWPGVYPFGQACGFQGIHYWWYGTTTTWGSCGDSALNAPWYEVSNATSSQPDTELRLTAAAEALRDQVDMLLPAMDKCSEPPDFHHDLSRAVGPSPGHTYKGSVTAGGVPLANAFVVLSPIDCNGTWRDPISTYTDGKGKYLFHSDFPAAQVVASHFGYQTRVWPLYGASSAVPPIELPRVSALPSIPTPVPPKLACRGADGWVPQ